MPNLKTPGKKLGKGRIVAPAAAPSPAKIGAGRLANASRQAGQAAARLCLLIERQKAAGVTVADIEEELGLDTGDLKSHFDAAELVAENNGFDAPPWT